MICKSSRMYRNTYINLLSLKKTLKSSKKHINFFMSIVYVKAQRGRNLVWEKPSFILPSVDYLIIKNKIGILFTVMIVLTVV